MNAIESIAVVRKAWEVDRERQRRPPQTKRTHVYASQMHDCVRRIALDLLHPEDEVAPDVDALERMQRGKDREDQITARLMSIGKYGPVPFRVISGQERFEIKDRDGRVLISGKIDGRLEFDDGTRAVYEVKAGNSFANCQTLDDMLRGKWSRKAPSQLLLYLYADKSAADPHGFFVLDRSGIPNMIPMHAGDHLEWIETLLQRARAAIDALDGGPLPPFTDDARECKGCPHFGKSCTPPLNFGDGLRVIENEDLIALAEEWWATREAGKVSARAWEELKVALRGTENGVLGDFHVSGTWRRGKGGTDDDRAFVLKIEKVVSDGHQPCNEDGEDDSDSTER